jgi:hypothetical protein
MRRCCSGSTITLIGAGFASVETSQRAGVVQRLDKRTK